MKHRPNRTEAIAELIELLATRLHTSAYAHGLTPAQWNALRFLDRANASARTLTAFARYQGTTKGSASQTLSLLQRKGLVRPEASPDDRRVNLLSLTQEGSALLHHDPMRTLRSALTKVPPGELDPFLIVLERLLRDVFDGDVAVES